MTQAILALVIRLERLDLLLSEEPDEIAEDSQIDEQEAEPEPVEMAAQFKKLPGQERDGEEEGEVLCPDLFEH